MPLHEYKWVENVNMSALAPNCRGKECSRAHYKYKLPKRKMVALVVEPYRANRLNFIWFCNSCKTIRFPKF